jgi:hypothetical protein
VVWFTHRMVHVEHFDIPSLRPDRLAATVPTSVYCGGAIVDPQRVLFVWRTCRFPAEARGGVLSFFVDDYRFAALWRSPERYAEQFHAFGWGAIVEPDFSTWRDDPLTEQRQALYRMRTLGRLYQEHGLSIIPNLAWSDERSYEFAFTGIPRGVPVAATECRTPGGCDHDRRLFLAGLTRAVDVVQPRHIIVYGGAEHSFWLAPCLPPGPQYTLLPSWAHERDKIRRQAERALRNRHQLQLFPGGESLCTESQYAPV